MGIVVDFRVPFCGTVLVERVRRPSRTIVDVFVEKGEFHVRFRGYWIVFTPASVYRREQASRVAPSVLGCEGGHGGPVPHPHPADSTETEPSDDGGGAVGGNGTVVREQLAEHPQVGGSRNA